MRSRIDNVKPHTSRALGTAQKGLRNADAARGVASRPQSAHGDVAARRNAVRGPSLPRRATAAARTAPSSPTRATAALPVTPMVAKARVGSTTHHQGFTGSLTEDPSSNDSTNTQDLVDAVTQYRYVALIIVVLDVSISSWQPP